MRTVMYAHGGSKNHGCEAIVRATADLIKEIDDCPILLTRQQEEDITYGLDQIVEVRQGSHNINKRKLGFGVAYLQQKLRNNYHQMDALQYKQAIENLPEVDTALFIGGDNYCYSNVKNYSYINNYMRKKAENLVLWGASVEPELLEDKEISHDIERFHCIVARESISYKALRKVNKHTMILPDPAFFLQSVPVNLPQGFLEYNMIGINISPLVINLEKQKDILMQNYKRLLSYILENSTYNVALIPHVIWDGNDDREPLKYLYQEFKDSGRIIMVMDHNCMEQKYIISKCRMFIGARTHATIAAYSMGVPTLVVGYSVKARGIARDLFGTETNFVLAVQNIKQEDNLVNSYLFLEKNNEKIHKQLQDKMYLYRKYQGEYKRSIAEKI